MRPALDPTGHRVHRTKPTCLLHTWSPHRQRPFALVIHLHQHQSNRNLHLQYLAKNQFTQRCQSLTTHGPQKHTRKHEKGGMNRTKKQSCQPLADRPARQGGQSAMAVRTVRHGTADFPHPCRGLSGLSRGPFVKANRTTRTDPRKTDHPRRPGGPAATEARTVRKPAATKT
jgi:hypothetical protein